MGSSRFPGKPLVKIDGREMPSNVQNWPYEVATLFREHGHNPENKNAKENFLEIKEDYNRHNVLYGAKIARRIYMNLKSDN